jgi:hypothetical protein
VRISALSLHPFCGPARRLGALADLAGSTPAPSGRRLQTPNSRCSRPRCTMARSSCGTTRWARLSTATRSTTVSPRFAAALYNCRTRLRALRRRGAGQRVRASQAFRTSSLELARYRSAASRSPVSTRQVLNLVQSSALLLSQARSAAFASTRLSPSLRRAATTTRSRSGTTRRASASSRSTAVRPSPNLIAPGAVVCI